MPFTEFCCRSGGNNLNAGTVDGGSTEPSTSPLVTYTGGDWNAATDVYTAPIGADMTEAVVGRFAALYHDGDTAPVNNQYLVARIIAVDAGLRTITLSTTARQLLGTEVATGTGNRSLRIGGAWSGPAAAVTFPFTFISASLTNSTGNLPRLNVKNDQTYTVTTGISTNQNNITIQGYTTSYGDGGRFTLTCSTGSVTIFTYSGSGQVIVDAVIGHSGTGGTTRCLSCVGNSYLVRNVYCYGARNEGFLTNGTEGLLECCEAYDCNKANAGATGISLGTTCKAIRCVSHNHAGSNSNGFYISGNNSYLESCISAKNGANGLNLDNANGIIIKNCDFYDNAGSGVRLNTNTALRQSVIENCNFLSNGAWGILTAGTAGVTIVNNCGFGSGTQANASGNISEGGLATSRLYESGTVTYPSNQTPWVDPDNGDFSITLAQAKNAGRGSFLNQTPSFDGTVGYPDIGAAQANASAGGGSSIFSPFTQQVIG